MSKLPPVKPLPHKAIFKKHGVSLGQVAEYIDRSYPFVSNVLSGCHKAGPETRKRLDELLEHLEGRKA